MQPCIAWCGIDLDVDHMRGEAGLAFVALRTGDGPLARVAVERALSVAPARPRGPSG
ncbi:hypothetical protein AB0L30_27835 [Microbispora rosea]|uniref:hypothetical protein n=1 Tax=Microbispora rosea TaxID=58117 RepID=UPI003420AC46